MVNDEKNMKGMIEDEEDFGHVDRGNAERF